MILKGMKVIGYVVFLIVISLIPSSAAVSPLIWLCSAIESAGFAGLAGMLAIVTGVGFIAVFMATMTKMGSIIGPTIFEN